MAHTSQPAKFLRYWVPFLAYVALIFTLSSMPRLRPPLGFPNVDKVVHMGEYMILGWLAGRALHTVPGLTGLLAAGLAAIALGAMVGWADELYQSTVPGRDASVLDWIADFLGVTISQIGYAWFKRPRPELAAGAARGAREA